MRLRTADGEPLWLGYGMNVHPGGDVETTLDAIRSTVLPLKRRLGVDSTFGLAVRWSAEGVEQLLAHPAWQNVLREQLRANDLAIFTGNAFVHGEFHGQSLKEEVYRPPWSDPRRLAYTLRFAGLLAALSEEGARLSLSTSPCSWGVWPWRVEEMRACAVHLVACARGLRQIEDRTGVRVVLGLEPEPGCVLQRADQVLDYFAAPLAEAMGRDEALRDHLGICYDVCHQAVEWEDVESSLAALQASGIPVAKVQASCALELPDPQDPRGREALRQFDEPVYLHQVGARDADGRVWVAPDLGDVLDDPDWHARGPWRSHFHVPVFRAEAVPPLRTTQPELARALRRVAAGGLTRHVEIETYTWDVLPEAERAAGSGFDLVEALARETEYVLGVLEDAGATREGAHAS
jgi:hypothetical protein